MLTPELEQLISYAVADGEITEQEKSVLYRKATEANVDMDEFEMVLAAKLHDAQQAAAEKALAQQQAAPKSNSKYGEVRKCPACGTIISEFSTKCPECGHEFSNVAAVKSANLLFEKLQELEMQKARELATHEESKNRQLQDLSMRHNQGGAINQLANVLSKDRQNEERDDLVRTLERGAAHIERKFLDAKINMIKTYTVPNTKSDLLELLSMATSSAYDNDGVIGPEEEAWLQKTDQIYQKIVICAADDQVTLNQATNMLVSLIKRLPSNYKNFTRIPKELRDRITSELKAQKAEKFDNVKNCIIGNVKSWKGIVFGVGVILLIVGAIVSWDTGVVIGIILIGVICYLVWRQVKEQLEDPLA